MLKLLQEVCSLPTAPFAEQLVIEYAERFVKARKGLKLSRDRFGNLLIELQGKSKRRQPRWVFGAHMDHPGFVASRMIDARTLEAHFRGWVQIDYVRGTRVRFFDGNIGPHPDPLPEYRERGKEGRPREITGTVIDATSDQYDRLTVPNRVRIRVSGSVPRGCPGMFDQGEGRVKGSRFLSRACDDLGGLAGALAMIDQLHRNPPAAPIAVLLTRAEEEGFIGALASVLYAKLLRKSDRIIAIETSAMQPYAPQGAGAIIRVGDKTSIFNSGLTYFLTQQAEALAKKDKGFKFQRALMPGGTCEATVYDAWGYTASSICVALGNYHNMDRAKERIGSEYIDINDWKSMVKLFVHIARTAHTFDPENRPLKKRLEKRFNRLKKLL